MAESERDAAVTRYVAAARNVPALSREEETELAKRFRETGDAKAAERLIQANLRHVVAIAMSYRRYGLRVSELISEGNLGLMMAIGKFDPDRGVRFVTYAAYWARAYILNYVIRSWSMVGGGSGPLRSKIFFKLRRERATVASIVGDDERTSMEMLAERMGTTVERTQELTQRLDARDVSLDVPIGEEGRTTMLEGLSDGGPTQEERFFEHEQHDALRKALRDAVDTLDERERFIVEKRLMSDEDLSLAEIGRRLGVSRERARQLEERAKLKLRKCLGALAELLDWGAQSA
jgi:RNA polymerase sigma-32 factor